MIEPWHNCVEHAQWPAVVRAYIEYCRRGPRRRNGGAIAGNTLFRLTRHLQSWLGNEGRYAEIQFPRAGLGVFLDPTDLESLIHTLPAFSRGTTGWKFVSQSLVPGDVFVDIGANYGIYTLQAAKLVGLSGRVLAFEPNPQVRAALEMSLERNGLTNVILCPEALAAEPGSARLWNGRASGGASLSEPDAGSKNQSQASEVVVETLDRVLERTPIGGRVALVKVDVEGWELNVFRGAKTFLTTHSPPLVFEVNDEALKRSGTDATQLESCLRDYGYDRFVTMASAAWGDSQQFDFRNVSGVANVLAMSSARH